MKFVVFTVLAMFMCSCITAQPVSPNRKIHPEFSDLDDLEMMLLNDHETIYENKTEQRRLLADNSFQQQNIRIGMARRNVQMKLGNPTRVDVAGNPKYGNERWTYETEIPTLDGYYTERKVIYFEGGAVVGWESQ